jgi:2,4-dienoyl-CoA reductase-like NADH-dependent reductase (Old Yellow Enzyme family)
MHTTIRTTTMRTLLTPFNLAGLDLPNRTVMAPMTRARAVDGVPDAQTALYYSQRASAGLIVSEGIPVSQEGTGFLFNPGLYTDAQQAGWRQVTDAVHAAGGRIFAQLWHVGRLSHVSLQEDGAPPVSSVARQAEGSSAYAWQQPGVAGQVPASVPRALATDEIPRIIEDFVLAARRAMAAGFDGVELHGANGYLFEQFINGALNTRDDAWGGSIDNRLRLLLDTFDAVSAEVGAHRVAVRISPFGRLYDMQPFDGEDRTWLTLAAALNDRQLAYVHTSDQLTLGQAPIPARFASAFRQAYRGTLVSAGGFDRDSAEAALQSGALDLVAFGRPFIANPDFVERITHGWPLAEADRATFYGLHGAAGYTDYPTWQPATTAI